MNQNEEHNFIVYLFINHNQVKKNAFYAVFQGRKNEQKVSVSNTLSTNHIKT